MGFQMKAKRRGSCAECGNTIKVGDEIFYEPDNGTAEHALCASGKEEAPPSADAHDKAIGLGFSDKPSYALCGKCGKTYDRSIDPKDCPHRWRVAQ